MFPGAADRRGAVCGALMKLGETSFLQGRFVEAENLFLKALLYDPSSYAAALNAGASAASSGSAARAVSLFSWVISLEPQSSTAVIESAKAHMVAESWGAAAQRFRHGLCLVPGACEALTGFANSLRRLGELEAASLFSRWACSADPASDSALAERGDCLRENRSLSEAIDALGRSLALNPDQPGVLLTAAYCHLHLGLFDIGWRLHEYRWRDRNFLQHHRESPLQRWRGQESIKGRKLLVFSEQGFGDTIQFVRFVSELPRFDASVTLLVPPGLSRLFGSLEGVDRVLSSLSDRDLFAACCSLMSLPDILRIDLESIPFKKKPYLFAAAELVDFWRARIRTGSGRKVGVCWSGAKNPRMVERSIPLSEFSRIFVEGDQYYSLQKEIRDSDLGHLHSLDDRLAHFDGLHEDFAATAGLIEHMDVVISIDTAVAHLAASMGKETWILLPLRADWRWLEARVDSPWYPHVRLFRQSRDGDWDDVIRRVREMLGQ